MHIFQKLAFLLFAKLEQRKLKTDKNCFFNKFNKNNTKKDNENNNSTENLNQPSRSNSTPFTKKLFIWIIVILIIASGIGIIVYFATRKTEILISHKADITLKVNVGKTNEKILTTTKSYKNANITSENIENSQIEVKDVNGPSFSFYLNELSLLKVYFAGGNNLKAYFATSSNLPIVLPISFVQSPTDTKVTIDNITISYNNNLTANNQLATFWNGVYTNATYPPVPVNYLSIISSLIPIIFFTLLIIFYIRMMKKGGMGAGGLLGYGKTTIENTKTKVKFSDVAGIQEVKDELIEIVDFVRNPKKYASMGARSPRGVMLYGPPGTGKTLIAKAVAGESNANFFPVAGSSFEDMLVGVGAKRVRDLFEKARKHAPAIIFIDEIDSVASKRGKNDFVGGGPGIADQTINQLLAEMDGFSTGDGVVVIAATNRLDVLDEAILRPGRFDRQIQVNLPDISEREQILKIHAKNKNLSKSVKLLDVARRTPGFSGAQLENVLNEATILAVRGNRTSINMVDLDEAIDRTVGGPKRQARVMTEEEKRQIAYHEAGHALIGLHTENTEVVQKITIIPRGNAAGYTLQTPQTQERQLQRRVDILNQVRMTLGGRAAEEIIFGYDNISTGAANDLYKISNMVRGMVMQMGMTDAGLTQYVPSEGPSTHQKLFSEATGKMLDEKIEAIIQAEYVKAKEVISKNLAELELIVETLLVLETILKDQIDYIHKNMKLPEEVIKRKAELEATKQAVEESKQDDKIDSQTNKDSQA